jgi:hypothetical protein
MAEPLDEPLGVVTGDELADDPLRLGECLELMERGTAPSTSAGGGSLPGVVVGFRALPFMPGLLGCRHRSPDGVQRNRVRFNWT